MPPDGIDLPLQRLICMMRQHWGTCTLQVLNPLLGLLFRAVALSVPLQSQCLTLFGAPACSVLSCFDALAQSMLHLPAGHAPLRARMALPPMFSLFTQGKSRSLRPFSCSFFACHSPRGRASEQAHCLGNPFTSCTSCTFCTHQHFARSSAGVHARSTAQLPALHLSTCRAQQRWRACARHYSAAGPGCALARNPPMQCWAACRGMKCRPRGRGLGLAPLADTDLMPCQSGGCNCPAPALAFSALHQPPAIRGSCQQASLIPTVPTNQLPHT